LIAFASFALLDLAPVEVVVGLLLHDHELSEFSLTTSRLDALFVGLMDFCVTPPVILSAYAFSSMVEGLIRS
jgi:hypothetical protein